MEPRTIPASEFKAKCLRLLDQLRERGEALVITKHGKPVARVVPLSLPGRSLRGAWTGIARIKGDIVHFEAGEDWEVSC